MSWHGVMGEGGGEGERERSSDTEEERREVGKSRLKDREPPRCSLC
jgi:hypothetical protein